MFNFIIQIIVSIFIGICFVFLAKRYQKNKVFYFCVGFFVCLLIRIIYLVIYGFITDFVITQNLNHHKNISILISIVISYLIFRVFKYQLEINIEDVDINDIGKQYNDE